MTRSRFPIDALQNLQTRAESEAKKYPPLWHVLVLPLGQDIRVPEVRPGFLPGFTDLKGNPSPIEFGDTKLIGPLPPKSCWPRHAKPLRAVVAEQAFHPFRPNAQNPYRIHLFFGGNSAALSALQTLAKDVAVIRDDVIQAINVGGNGDSRVFYRSSALLHGEDTTVLDAWLCTVHWWSWAWTECLFHTRPRVMVSGQEYEVGRCDEALRKHLGFSVLDVNIFGASAAILGLIIRFIKEPPAFGWENDYPPITPVKAGLSEPLSVAASPVHRGEPPLHSAPLALSTDEILKQLEDNLRGFLIKTPKRARAWCEEHGIKGYSRNEWKSTFKCDPPSLRGQPTYYNSADVLRAIATENEAIKRADDAKVETEQRAKAVRKENNPQFDPDNF